jgi:hypothetical protein
MIVVEEKINHLSKGLSEAKQKLMGSYGRRSGML